MHAIILILLLVWLLIVMASIIIPSIAISVSSSFIGSKANLNDKDKLSLKIYFFIIGGTLFSLMTYFEEGSIMIAVMNFFLWPVALLLPLFGGLETTREYILVFGVVILTFVIVQIIAIIKILISANENTPNLN